MTRISLIFGLLLIGSIVTAAQAQDQRQKDAANLIKAARFLEEKPLDKEAKGIRGWAVSYLMETKDVNVTVCGGFLMQPLLDKKNKNSTEMIGQYMIGMGAYKVANPDKNDDENEAQFAGLESAIKAYKAIIAEKPKTRFPGMDDLATKLDKGELKSLVIAADCTKKK
jgi:hypothetical protein